MLTKISEKLWIDLAKLEAVTISDNDDNFTQVSLTNDVLYLCQEDTALLMRKIEAYESAKASANLLRNMNLMITGEQNG